MDQKTKALLEKLGEHTALLLEYSKRTRDWHLLNLAGKASRVLGAFLLVMVVLLLFSIGLIFTGLALSTYLQHMGWEAHHAHLTAAGAALFFILIFYLLRNPLFFHPALRFLIKLIADD